MEFREQKSNGPVWLTSFYTKWGPCLLPGLCQAWLQHLQEVTLTPSHEAVAVFYILRQQTSDPVYKTKVAFIVVKWRGSLRSVVGE